MLSRAESRRIRGLARRRNREREGLFVVEGVRAVEEVLDGGLGIRLAVLSSSLADTARGERLADRLEARLEAADVRRAGDGALKELGATVTTQGVLVVAEIPDAVLDAVVPAARSLALVLDGVQDPGNLGTLARSAAGFGCDVVACMPGTVDPWNPKAVRASAGALFRLPVVQPTWEAMDAWRAGRDYGLLGADVAGQPVDRAPRPDRIALVVGNEGAGLSPEARDRCDALVAVPMQGGTESLNVAVAGGILLYELTRESR